MGKTDNNDDGRNVYKSDIIDYLLKLQKMNTIQNFDGANDISVVQGAHLDEVIVELNIQPVDAMEKMYMTVTVRES